MLAPFPTRHPCTTAPADIFAPSSTVESLTFPSIVHPCSIIELRAVETSFLCHDPFDTDPELNLFDSIHCKTPWCQLCGVPASIKYPSKGKPARCPSSARIGKTSLSRLCLPFGIISNTSSSRR